MTSAMRKTEVNPMPRSKTLWKRFSNITPLGCVSLDCLKVMQNYLPTLPSYITSLRIVAKSTQQIKCKTKANSDILSKIKPKPIVPRSHTWGCLEF